jgi:hypothetical protein
VTGQKTERQPFETSLGPVCEPHSSHWDLDLSDLPPFRGLSVLSRALSDAVVAQACSDRADINVERGIRQRENPELLEHLGVTRVRVCAEHETVAEIAQHPDRFGDRLRALFGTLQRARYRDALFSAEQPGGSRALVFHFDFPPLEEGAPVRLRFVLERVRSNRPDGESALRVTIEDPRGRRLSLDSIPHVEVQDVDRRTFIAGSTRIAQTWREALRREAERGRQSFVDRRTPRNHLFQQLDHAGLEALRSVEIHWGDEFAPTLLSGDPDALDPVLKKVLLALEDRQLRRLLAEREVIRLELGGVAAFLDLSQHERVLNVSLGRRRERVDIDQFLARMPSTAALCGDDAPLADVKVLLVHHITAEALGLIAALRRLGCRDLVTLFVAYTDDAPSEYLDPLLDLPPDEFQAFALSRVPDEERIEGVYRLSNQYSALPHDDTLADVVSRGRPRFFDAMQRVGARLFLDQVRRAEADGQRCMVIEDGGYVAPMVNRACLEGRTVREFLAESDPSCRDDRALRKVLDPHFIGSVEHTRNGHDRLRAVETKRQGLAFPAFSIAVSRLKREVEAREVAISLLNAVDNALHASGLVLSRRRCLVLGSRGAIGRHAMAFLHERLMDGDDQLAGVDLAVDGAPVVGHVVEAQRYAALPRELRMRMDLVLGVTGVSVLTGLDLEEWLLDGEAPRLILASGSTKTEEFAELASWMEENVLGRPDLRIRDRHARVWLQEMRDPLSGRIFGRRCRFALEADGGAREREVIFLANGTPVNFLFYGVPTELIDQVLAELVGVSLGLLVRTRDGAVAPRLHAVDAEIDSRGRPLD